MKYFLFVCSLLAVLLSSCGNSGNERADNYSGTSVESDPEVAEFSQSKGKKKGKKLIMTPMTNTQTGELMGHIPIPSGWKLSNGRITGPNGIETGDFPARTFTYQQRMPMNLEQVVRQDLYPGVSQNGGKILGTFEIPELANYDRAYFGLLWQFGNPRMGFYALGVDVQRNDEKKSLYILRQFTSEDQFGSMWSYYINQMDANNDAYEEAKNDYIFALSHVHPNLDQIDAYNKREIAKSNASWAAHNQRMAANQAAFNARNQAWMESSNAVNESIMQGWRDRNAISDAGQANTIDMIREEKNVYDGSGNVMKVEAGSRRYFTNGNNEYIRTDDYLFDPNTNKHTNMYNWKEWK